MTRIFDGLVNQHMRLSWPILTSRDSAPTVIGHTDDRALLSMRTSTGGWRAFDHRGRARTTPQGAP